MQKQASSNNIRRTHYQRSSPPDLTQTTPEIPSYYISADCDTFELPNNRLDKSSPTTKMSDNLQDKLSNTETANNENFQLPMRTGILMKHGSDSEGSAKGSKPKKRVQIQTDVSIV